MSEVVKSRKIPLSEFYSILQLEYLSLYLRSKIFKEPFIQYNIDSCIGKRKKIESISRKNNLPNIFSSKKILEKYVDQLVNDWGVPNFQYKNEAIKDKIHIWDCVNYFTKGTLVKFRIGDEEYSGTILFNNFEDKICKVSSSNLKRNVDVAYGNISRAFSENFWENLY